MADAKHPLVTAEQLAEARRLMGAKAASGSDPALVRA